VVFIHLSEELLGCGPICARGLRDNGAKQLSDRIFLSWSGDLSGWLAWIGIVERDGRVPFNFPDLRLEDPGPVRLD
jgi:hypothetical protein